MKKLIITISLTVAAIAGYSQGTISTINGSASEVSTNGVTTGATAAVAGQYYFALLTASMTSFGVAASTPTALQLAEGSGWTFTGNQTTNIGSLGRENGGANIPTGSGWAPGVTNSYVLVGWSVNEGTTWSQVAAEVISGNWLAQGYFGFSSVAFGEAGGGAQSLPAFSLFGTGATAAGTPLTSGFDLNPVGTPEPATMALAAIGGASLLLFRRKK